MVLGPERKPPFQASPTKQQNITSGSRLVEYCVPTAPVAVFEDVEPDEGF